MWECEKSEKSETKDHDSSAFFQTLLLERVRQLASEHARLAAQLTHCASANRGLEIEFSKLQRGLESWATATLLQQAPAETDLGKNGDDLEDPEVASERIDLQVNLADGSADESAIVPFQRLSNQYGHVSTAQDVGEVDNAMMRGIDLRSAGQQEKQSAASKGANLSLRDTYKEVLAPLVDGTSRLSGMGKPLSEVASSQQEMFTDINEEMRQKAAELVARVETTDRHSIGDSGSLVARKQSRKSQRLSAHSNGRNSIRSGISSFQSVSIFRKSKSDGAAPSARHSGRSRHSGTSSTAISGISSSSLCTTSEVDPRLRGVTVARMSGNSENLLFQERQISIKVGSVLRDGGVLQHFVSEPGDRRKVLWDIIGAFLVVYDIIFISFVHAFEPQELEFMRVITWFSAVYWTLDIPKSFLSGFHHRGILEMRVHKVTAKYAQTWFPFDLIVLVIDWMFIIVAYLERHEEKESGSVVRVMKSGRWLRILRILRACRLIRLARLVRFLNQVMNSFSAEVLRVRLQALAALLGICVLNHIIACLWYWIGSNTHLERTWLLKGGFIDRGIMYRYLTSLHWALTQCTPASMEVFPTNSYERAFAVCTLVFGLFTFSSFVSAITQKMTQLFSITHERLCQNVNMRRYFAENSLSLECTEKILDFLDFKMHDNQRQIHEADIPILKVLPERIRIQMHVEIYMPALLWIPFFEYFKELDNPRLRSVCHAAVSEQTLLPDQELFMKGAQATSVYFINHGHLSYHRRSQECDVTFGSWVSEAALWMAWIHRGRLSATGICEIYTLDSSIFNVFISCCQPTSKTAVYCASYAFEFANMDNLKGGGNLSDLCSDYEEMQTLADNAFHKALRQGRH